VSLIGWLRVFVSDTAMALVEQGALLGSRQLGSRQLDMGNSGLHVGERYFLLEVAQVA